MFSQQQWLFSSKKVTQPGVSVVCAYFATFRVILSSSLSWDNFSQPRAFAQHISIRHRGVPLTSKCVYQSREFKSRKKDTRRERSLALLNNWEQCHSSFTSAGALGCCFVVLKRASSIPRVDSEKGRVPARRISELLDLVERTQCARFVYKCTWRWWISSHGRKARDKAYISLQTHRS